MVSIMNKNIINTLLSFMSIVLVALLYSPAPAEILSQTKEEKYFLIFIDPQGVVTLLDPISGSVAELFYAQPGNALWPSPSEKNLLVNKTWLTISQSVDGTFSVESIDLPAPVLEATSGNEIPGWSPDESMVSYKSSDEAVWIVDNSGKTQRVVTAFGTVRWSSSGDWLAFCGLDKKLWAGRSLETVKSVDENLLCGWHGFSLVSWSPTRDLLAYTTGTDVSLAVVNTDYDHHTKIFDAGSDQIRVLAEGESGEWTKDGNLLLVNRVLGDGSGGIPRDVYAINVQMGQSINIQHSIDKDPGIFTWLKTDKKYFYGGYQISSDATHKTYLGRALMGVSQNGETGLIYRDDQSIYCVNFENNLERKLLDTYKDGIPAALWPAAWANLSADGRWASIYYEGIKDGKSIGGGYLYDCAGEKLPLEAGSIGFFSPDSRWWVTESWHDAIKVIDLSTGQSIYQRQFGERIRTHAYWITSGEKIPKSEGHSSVFEGQIAYVGLDGNVYLLRGDTGETIQITNDATDTERYASPKFSPSAQQVAFAKNLIETTAYGTKRIQQSSLYFVNLAVEGNMQSIASDTSSYFEWISDSDNIGYLKKSTLYTYSVENTNTSKIVDDAVSFSWSPDATKLITGNPFEIPDAPVGFCGPEDSLLRDFEANSELHLDGALQNWSFDGKWIAMNLDCYGSMASAIVNSNSGNEINVTEKYILKVEWSPVSNSFVAVVSQYPDVYESILISNVEGSFKHEMPLLVYDFLWSPDGAQIVASGEQNTYLIDPITATYRPIINQPLSILTWSPSGKQIMLASQETGTPELMIYDISSNSVILRGIYVDGDFVYHKGMWAKLADNEVHTYTISGKVTKLGDNSSVAGVEVFLNRTLAATTNQNGEYLIKNVPTGIHLVQPKTDFLYFIPPIVIVNLTENRSDLNFVASEKTQDPIIYLEAIEVTQGLQNLKNSIPLIAEKETVVRVYFTSTSVSPVKLEGRLIGRRNGEAIQEQLEPITPSVDVYPDKNIDDIRGDFSTTLNFLLPPAWTKGDVEVEFVSENSFVSLLPDGKNLAKVSFVDMPVLEMDVFRVIYSGEYGGMLDNYDIYDLIFATQNYLPVGKIKYNIRDEHFWLHDTNLTALERLERVNSELRWKRLLDGCELTTSCKRYYLGVLAYDNAGLASGHYISSGYWSWDDGMKQADKSRSVFAHELAHNLERLHTPTEINLLSESCEKPEDNRDYPPYLGLSENTLGEDAVYGLAIKQGDERYTVIPPTYADLMSYCVHNWTSQWTYEKLFNEIRRRYKYSQHQTALVSEGLSYFIVGGAVSDEMNVNISSIFSLTVNDLDNNTFGGTGDYILQSEDGQGNVIATTYFSLENGIGSEYSHQSFFLTPLPFSPEAKSISILYDGRVIERRDATENVPIINLIFPSRDENWSGDKGTISWEASDNDGDELQYVVQLSYDGGQTWRTEAVNLTETYLELPLEFIPGTNQALVRVLASDGFHTAQAVSNSTFTIAGHNPYVYITTPTDGREYMQSQHILLYGEGYDVEDGQLSDSAFSWRSNKAGILGQGKNLTIPAGELQAGEHFITLVVTDSDGTPSESTITIFVKNPDNSLTTEPSIIIPLQWWIYAGIATGVLILFSLMVGGVWLLKIPKSSQKVERTKISGVRKRSLREMDNISLGIQLAKESRYQESFEILRQEIKVHPHHVEAWLFLGFDLANLGDNTSAKHCFERAKRLGASSADQALAWLEKRSSRKF